MNHLTASWAGLRTTAAADTLEDIIESLEQQIERADKATVYTRTKELRDAGHLGQSFPYLLAAWKYLREVVVQEIPGFDPGWLEVKGGNHLFPVLGRCGWSADEKKATIWLGDSGLNELVVLHELAHLILQYRGSGSGHGAEFQRVCSDLYQRRLGFTL